MIYVVLGMHKSGTTLVSQILHKSGISMGENLEESVSYNQGNQWERRESWLINLKIIGCSEPDYYSLDHSRRVHGAPTHAIASMMDEMIQRCEDQNSDWGFKDPLTCLTYSLWRCRLPTHRIVAVYRSPEDVLRHYVCRHRRPTRALRVIRAWTSYNQGIVEALRAAGSEGICVRYEELMKGDAELERLSRFVGRDLVDMRRWGNYRARSGRPLFALASRGVAAFGRVEPRGTLRALDARRAAEISTGH